MVRVRVHLYVPPARVTAEVLAVPWAATSRHRVATCCAYCGPCSARSAPSPPHLLHHPLLKGEGHVKLLVAAAATGGGHCLISVRQPAA